MALTTDDLNAVIAQWEEWTADKGFRLSIEVRVREVTTGVDVGYQESAPQMLARIHAESLYCQVEIYKCERCVFSERVPYDYEALRASVSVLARTIAGWDGGAAEGESGG